LRSSNSSHVSEITGNWNWTQGTIRDTTVIVSTTGTLNLTGVNTIKVLNNASIINHHIVNMNGTGTGGQLKMGNASLFDNQATGVFNIQNNDSILYDTSAQSSFINRGTLNKAGGPGVPYSILGSGNLSFDNYGTVNVMTGT